MTTLRRLRVAFFALGVLLVVGMLLGARLLSPGSGGGSDPAPKTAASADGKNGGLVVHGYVYSDPQPTNYGLPQILQSGTVAEIFVKEGDEVKKGAPLYRFDTTIQERELTVAKWAVDVAKARWDEAKGAVAQHELDVKAQEQMVAAAKQEVVLAQAGYHNYEHNLRAGVRARYGPSEKEKIEAEVFNDPKRFEMESAYKIAVLKRDAAEVKLDAMRAAKVNKLDKVVAEAEAAVRQAEAIADAKKAAVELCTIQAQEVGTVERISISRGAVIGVSTREPALILVPAGPRIVRAEVEAEFAHKVGPDKKGKEVTIYDHADPRLTYKGVVERIGKSFLRKRGGGDGPFGNDTLALEVVVKVTDPNPPGKPPLRVGQKVKVNLGQ
jgi:multidrug resistance efflux pump